MKVGNNFFEFVGNALQINGTYQPGLELSLKKHTTEVTN